jgi:hypothetical protein
MPCQSSDLAAHFSYRAQNNLSAHYRYHDRRGFPPAPPATTASYSPAARSFAFGILCGPAEGREVTFTADKECH